MDDVIGVEVGEGQGYVVAEIHISVVGKWIAGSLQEFGQALTINSINSTGSLDSGSWYVPK